MYKHILIPTDGSALSEEAIRQGVVFAKSINATVTAVTVSPSFHTMSMDTMMLSDTREQYQKDCDARAERYLAFAREIARASGVPCEAVHVVNDHPYEGIIEAARTKGCDLILHGLAWAQGCCGARAWQRDDQGPDAQQDPDPGLPLAGRATRKKGRWRPSSR
jgi:nucleotide-binding universal stress UspA family protein